MQLKMHETVRGKKPKSNRNSKGASTPKVIRRKRKALSRLRKKLKTLKHSEKTLRHSEKT